MFFTKRICAAGIIALVLAAAAFPADTVVVEITGYVSDWAGQPVKGASVHLKNANLTVATDTMVGDPGPGYFRFDALVPMAVQAPIQKAASVSRPFLASDGLHFSVSQNTQQVKIDLFTLSGRKAFELVNSSMKQGNYRVPIRAAMQTSQTYVVRARIGDQTSFFKVPMLGSRVGSAAVQAFTGKTPANSLAKKAAVIDSLIVSMPSIGTNSWPIESYSGSHYLILRTPAQMQNKVLSFTCTTNQGTTDNDPAVTLCTTIFAKDMSGNLDYRNTMFVNWWLSQEGYSYPQYIVNPDWRGPDSNAWATFKSSNTAYVDAITKATPIIGKCSFEFNPGNLTLTAGIPYRFCFEMNVDNQYNIMYSDSITLGTQTVVRTPAIQYVPSADPAASVVPLADMVISYQ
ncbi:MAG TPA: carboxypeptidase-like regulatory domain-containing protein [Chitinivibrionales bacterium]|nr:carboxypeptidase-like regulatory domain-containing protein [Chitinivibrionales bacterium]